MEYFPHGSLFKVLSSSKYKITYSLILKMALDTANGMRYLHEHEIIHGDLKSGNLLV